MSFPEPRRDNQGIIKVDKTNRTHVLLCREGDVGVTLAVRGGAQEKEQFDYNGFTLITKE